MPVKKMGPDRPMFFRTVDQRLDDKAGDIGAAETETGKSGKKQCACGILTRVEQPMRFPFHVVSDRSAVV